jgi:glycosyltransferase involved in cell wall biosynthesis
VFNAISAQMKGIEIDRKFTNFFKHKIQTGDYDVVFCQNSTLLRRLNERLKTICRLGGNRTFDDNRPELEKMLQEMSKCFCIVATNQKLYDIASAIHDKVYLIPNGLDLEEWRPVKRTVRKSLTVGFCANISTETYRHYKGYDFVEEACNNAGVELKTALYQNKQIPHDKMRELFYGQIDCIVHPTLGEGCSNTLMEACACGIPIITTECAGYHGELMKDGKDVLFVERSTESIQTAIEKLRNDKALRAKLGKGSRAFAEKHHDVTEIVKQYEEIFKECDQANKSRPPEVKFFSIIYRGNKAEAAFNINGGRAQSRTFPGAFTKEQIREKIIADIDKDI